MQTPSETPHEVTADKVILIYTTTSRPWKPYKGTFEGGGEVYLALAFPGGFTGFGETIDSACDMAKARALAALHHYREQGGTDDAWWDSMLKRITPLVFKLVRDLKASDTLEPYGTDDGLEFERGASRGLSAVERPSDLIECR